MYTADTPLCRSFLQFTHASSPEIFQQAKLFVSVQSIPEHRAMHPKSDSMEQQTFVCNDKWGICKCNFPTPGNNDDLTYV